MPKIVKFESRVLFLRVAKLIFSGNHNYFDLKYRIIKGSLIYRAVPKTTPSWDFISFYNWVFGIRELKRLVFVTPLY